MAEDGIKIGYVRVSSKDQNEARQIRALKDQGVSEEHIYIDKCSGANADRPSLKAMLSFVRKGDVVIVEDFSRLSRSITDLLSISDKLQQKNVGLVSLKEKLDTNTPTGRLLFNFIGILNQFEREMIKERQQEGIKIAKEQGKFKGRKPTPLPPDYWYVMDLLKNGTIKPKQAMNRLHLKKTAYYNMIKRYGSEKPQKTTTTPIEEIL